MTEPLGTGVEEVHDRSGAFPRLDEAQRRTLRALGHERRVKTGEVLFQEGDDFFVIEEGAWRSCRASARRTGSSPFMACTASSAS